MYIKEIHISAFGPIVDADFTFDSGLNIIEGANESGKSAIATFIKFIFYGLSARSGEGISDRQRCINWSRGYAAGHAVCVVESSEGRREVRVERTLNAKTDSEGRMKYSEKVRLLDNATSMPMQYSGQPGEFLFGVPENVFMGSAFAAQDSDIKPDGQSIREAVENIICAADENINVKRAADSLGKARIRLLHKNRTGGEIRDLEQRRDALESTAIESRESSSRLIRSEISLSDVKANIAAANRRAEELEELSRVMSVFSEEEKLREAVALEEKLAVLKSEAASQTAAAVDDKLMGTLAVAYHDIERLEKQKAELKKCSEELAANFPGCEDRDLSTDVERAKALGKKSDVTFNVGAVVMILGLAGIILSAFVGFAGKMNPLIPMVITFLTVIVGVGVIVVSRKHKNAYFDILDAWDAEDEEELEASAADAEKLYASLNSAKAAVRSAEVAAAEAEATVRSTAEKLGVPTGGVPTVTLLKLLAKVAAEKSRKSSDSATEASRIEGRLAAMVVPKGDAERAEIYRRADEVRDTKAGKTAAAMSEEERAAIARELSFVKNKAQNLRDRELDLERECAALKATVTSPATAAEELESITAELARLRRNHDALVLAGETLTAAGENIRSSVVPRLTSEASAIMSRGTGGRYGTLGISPSFDMTFRSDAFGTLELDYLSSGTKDMAYLALRVALVKALYGEDERPPVIFDESLAFLDEARVRAALELLSDEDVQVFLFTCRGLEASLAPSAAVTKLSRR